MQGARKNYVTLIGLAILTALFPTAIAQQGIQIGLSGYPASGVIGASIAAPLFKTDDVQHAARAGVAYAFRGAPALSVTYLLSDAASSSYSTYLGAGAGLAFPEAPAASPSFSGHALAGVNIHIAQNFGVFTEVTVAGNSFGTRMSAGVGISYTFGGNE